jgi:predicted metal-dependent HD superfamily phosphohydrolase
MNQSSSNDKDNTSLQDISNKWIHTIISLHSQSDRYYHTLAHLEEMFGYLDITVLYDSKKKNDIEDNKWSLLRTVTILSVFFHDAIYDAKSGTNEEDSVSLFQSFINDISSVITTITTTTTRMVDKWPGSAIVERFIMATKSHDANHLHSTDQDELFFLHLFLDADMSVLGKDGEAYDVYASMIRKEYIHVPHEVYCEKRSEILQSFVGDLEDESKSKSIYLSNDMRNALEAQAISNLRREISSLRSGIIPNA